MKKVMKRTVTKPTIAVITPFVTATAVFESPNSFLAPPLWSALARLVDEVVLRLQEAEPAASRRDLVQVVRHVVREVVHLRDERRDEERADAGHARAASPPSASVTAMPRRCTPCRWSQSTAGLSASDRKSAIRIHVIT